MAFNTNSAFTSSLTMTDAFNIRLIRDIYEENKSTDDIVTITPMYDADEPEFKVVMRTAGCQVDDNTPKIVSMKNMTGDEVYYYIQSLLTLLPLDEDKYESVQIDMPLMPSVLVRVKNVHKIIHHVLYHFYFIHENWPTKTKEHRRIRQTAPLPTHNDARRVHEQAAPVHNKCDGQGPVQNTCTGQGPVHNKCDGQAPEGARRHLFFDEDGDVSYIKTTFYE